MSNLSQMHYQRLLLNAMGVQLWAEKHTNLATIASDDIAIWRESDKIEPVKLSPQVPTTVKAQVEPKKTVRLHQEIAISQGVQQVKTALEQQSKIESNTQLEPSIEHNSIEIPEHTGTTTLQQQINVQIWISGKYMVIANIDERDEQSVEHWALWQNMKQAFAQLQHKYNDQLEQDYILRWDYPFLTLQNEQYAQYFVQGSLDYLFADDVRQQKQVFVLGDVPFVQIKHSNIQSFASLKEMHQDTAHKKQLWQAVLAIYQ